MNTISSFKDCLVEVVNQTTLHESNWGSENWKQLWSKINQEVLTDAFQKHAIVRSIFSDLGEITPRNCKSLSRVEKKMTEQAPGRENYFKVVSDFVAGRIHCNVNEIQAKIDRIREIVLANKGQMHVRGSSNERPYGFFMNAEKKYTDIIQFVYVFLDKVGYPIHFQIGHEFASHTFTIDSALRDNPSCGKVDLWNKNFYTDVKNYILNKANGIETGSLAQIQAKAEEIHQNNVPENLQVILNKL
jgi:hypothetical protein